MTDNLSNNSPILSNSLSDNEITITALKKILDLMLSDGDLQRASTISHAIDLINRLQEENECWQAAYMTEKQEIANLEIELKAMRGAANSYKAENERLKKGWKADVILTADTKAEAYKEFEEKLHEELRMYGVKDKFNKSVFLNVVDGAKKELLGDGNTGENTIKNEKNL